MSSIAHIVIINSILQGVSCLLDKKPFKCKIKKKHVEITTVDMSCHTGNTVEQSCPFLNTWLVFDFHHSIVVYFCNSFHSLERLSFPNRSAMENIFPKNFEFYMSTIKEKTHLDGQVITVSTKITQANHGEMKFKGVSSYFMLRLPRNYITSIIFIEVQQA